LEVNFRAIRLFTTPLAFPPYNTRGSIQRDPLFWGRQATACFDGSFIWRERLNLIDTPGGHPWDNVAPVKLQIRAAKASTLCRLGKEQEKERIGVEIELRLGGTEQAFAVVFC
jgi:hypothetical protein